MAQTHSYQQGLVGAFRNAAFAHYMLASYKSALAEALIALRMAEELDDKINQANALAVIALVQWSLGNYDEALKEAFRGLSISEEIGDSWDDGLGVHTIAGGICQSLGDYQQALQYHEKSKAKSLLNSATQLGEARALTGIGAVQLADGRSGSRPEMPSKEP